MNYTLHWCKVLEPDERNTDADGIDPSGAWRIFYLRAASGSTRSPCVLCHVCGKNVLEER